MTPESLLKQLGRDPLAIAKAYCAMANSAREWEARADRLEALARRAGAMEASIKRAMR